MQMPRKKRGFCTPLFPGVQLSQKWPVFFSRTRRRARHKRHGPGETFAYPNGFSVPALSLRAHIALGLVTLFSGEKLF